MSTSVANSSGLVVGLSLLLALSPAAAFAGGRAAPPASVAEGADVMQGLDCPTQATETARRYHMIADDVSAEAALARAKTMAREAARRDVCAQASDFTCEALLTQVVNEAARWVSLGGEGHRACATVAVPREVVERAARQGERVRAEINAMITPLRPATAFVTAPRWAGGCDTGPAGHALQVELQQRLRGFGHTLTPTPEAAAQRFEVVLRPGPDGREIIAAVSVSAAATVAPVGELRFDARLFGLDAEAGERCVAWEALGLSMGQRSGSTGARTEARFDRPERSFCEGEDAQLVIRHVDAKGQPVSADTFVISATHRGAAVLTMRDTTDSITVPVALSNAEGSNQAIAVFSVPKGVPPGPLGAASPMCRIREGLSANLIPEAAAVAMFSFTVEPEGTGRCAEVDPARNATRLQLRQIIETLPPCDAP